jgi:hypothetical protein
MKNIKHYFYKIFLAIFAFILPVVSFAQEHVPPATDQPVTIVNPIHAETINGLIKTILIGVIKIGIPVITLAVVYCGFLFVSAQGNSEKLSEAKRALVYTLIGAAILLGSWAIAQLVSDTVLAL